MTYNVNFGLAGDAETIEAIRAQDADLVLLQETTPEWEWGLRETLGERFQHIDFHHCCRAGGLAVLSKYPVETTEVIENVVAGGWFPSMRVVVDSPLGRVQVLSVHLRPQISESGSVLSGVFTTSGVRKKEIQQLAPRLSKEMPTLIVGDFNETASGSAIEDLEERGFKNVLPEFNPKATTWRWNTPTGAIKRTFDHILYDHRLEPLSAHALERGRSDHLPVVAVFVSGI